MTDRRDYSGDDMSYAMRLAVRGYDATMIFRALAAKPSGRREPGSIKYQRLLDERGRDAADEYARRTAEKAITWTTTNPTIRDRQTAILTLSQIEAAADMLPWGVYGGPGARRALEGAFVVGEQVGGVSFGLALRQWAELTGQEFRAARADRDVLVDLGWLHRNPDDRNGRTGRYTLRTPPHIHPHTGGENVRAPRDPLHLGHDAYRSEALGDMGWYIVHLVSGGAARLDVAWRTGLNPEDFEALVDRLELIGVLRVRGNTLRRTDNFMQCLDLVAAQAGTAGMGQRDRDQHEQDRQDFRGDVNVREVARA